MLKPGKAGSSVSALLKPSAAITPTSVEQPSVVHVMSTEPPPGIVSRMVGSGMSASSQPAAPKPIETSAKALKDLTYHLREMTVHTSHRDSKADLELVAFGQF